MAIEIETIGRPLISAIVEILRIWWWFFLPLILYFPAKFLYKWWVSWEVWYKELEWEIIEVIPPGEIEKPFKAMEDVYAALWPLYDGPNWREQWCEGEFSGGPFWFSFEIVSIEGQVHFYLRMLKDFVKTAENIIYANYPDAEIVRVEKDYVKDVPQNIPNEEYDFYGEDFFQRKDYALPLIGYEYFEAKAPEAVEGEKKIDPIHPLLEALAKLKNGEQGWFQSIIIPITDTDVPWVTHGREKSAELSKKPPKPKPRSVGRGVADLLIKGQFEEEEEEKKENLMPLEFRLSTREREVLNAVDMKISKYGFKVVMRYLYIYRRDSKVAGNNKIGRGYFSRFNAEDLNVVLFSPKTRAKIHYFFRKRRLYKRKRTLFETYVNRFPSCYPSMWNKDVMMILNTEELATLLHFPVKANILPPGVPRIFVKKKEFPPGIPVRDFPTKQ